MAAPALLLPLRGKIAVIAVIAKGGLKMRGIKYRTSSNSSHD